MSNTAPLTDTGQAPFHQQSGLTNAEVNKEELTASHSPQLKRKQSFIFGLKALIPCISNKAHEEDSSGHPLQSLSEKPTKPSRAFSISRTFSISRHRSRNNLVNPPHLTAASLTPSASSAGIVLPPEETGGVTAGSVVPPGKESRKRRKRDAGTQGIITSVASPSGTVRNDSSESEDSDIAEYDGDSEEEEALLIAKGGVGIPLDRNGYPQPLLPVLARQDYGKKCLVLDLDETLVHSSFKQMPGTPDFIVPVEIDNQFHNVYVIKRPGVDDFMKAMGNIYEIVVYTASLSKYADPVLDMLDIHNVIRHRLFRESCYSNRRGTYVKDLSQLGRPIGECIIIDNSPASYIFHPNNAVPCSSWFNDPHDTELTDLTPFLVDLADVEDIRSVLDASMYQ